MTRYLLAAGFAVVVTSPIWSVVLLAQLERRMAGMQHGPYRRHIDTLGRKRPCYPDRCGCAWRADEMEDAA